MPILIGRELHRLLHHTTDASLHGGVVSEPM